MNSDLTSRRKGLTVPNTGLFIGGEFVEAAAGGRIEVADPHDGSILTSIAEAREIIERWRVDYNERRPHRSPGQMTPSAFAIDQKRSLTTVSL